MSRLIWILMIIFVIAILVMILLSLRSRRTNDTQSPDDRILIAIPCIDRDASYIDSQYATIQHLLERNNISLLVLTRETDTKTIQKWTDHQISHQTGKIRIKLFPAYQIVERHNMEALVQKRNYTLEYAKAHHYDYVLFLDADILIQPDTLDKLHTFLRTTGDVVLVPYKVRWLGYPAVGVFSSGSMKIIPVIESEEAYHQCYIGGMGCTLIKRTAFDILFENKRLEDKTNYAYGEDIGFFVNLYHTNKHAYYLEGHPVTHLGS